MAHNKPPSAAEKICLGYLHFHRLPARPVPQGIKNKFQCRNHKKVVTLIPPSPFLFFSLRFLLQHLTSYGWINLELTSQGKYDPFDYVDPFICGFQKATDFPNKH